MPITLEAGDTAPAFELQDQDGKTHRLQDYRGQTVVLYFYPRDNTPGCTKQACGFRDNHDDIGTEGAIVLGVSTDTAASHTKFREQYELPFPLAGGRGLEGVDRVRLVGGEDLVWPQEHRDDALDLRYRAGWDSDEGVEASQGRRQRRRRPEAAARGVG